ncbi:hypothetical protein [Luteolibacter soli]|uniref:DUF2269 domain-containing protein n=1 Tax=Luteolibacter soli TaxID=3135280 RepID=A0ABU9B4C5_9BACT
MDEDSPYQTPLSSAPPALPQGPQPQVVKVFGILHIVLGGLGILFGIWGLFSLKFTSMLQSARANDPVIVVQRKYMEDLWPVTVMHSTFTLGLAALLLVAGLKLVREKPDGIMWSNRYSWTSITAKIISLVVTVGYVLPLSNRMTGEILNTRGMPAGSADMTTGMVKSMTSIASVASPVLSCLYPALALFFLSRPAVKAWAARTR